MSSQKKLIREKFRKDVFVRDKYKCTFCPRVDALDAHHIIDRNEIPNGGYVKENGITLCPEHHELAEVYHQSNGMKWAPGFHPDDLYKKIKSSKDKAFKAAEQLS